MSPQDRNGNRYLIDFVGHSSNYVRVFLVKNKVEATKKFEYFLVFFEKQAGRAARAGTKSDKEKKKAKRKASG
ncbi:hypothetical protein PF005_g6060 [Phytophthora fragariae]|uniref:Uncharacterized protein n=1 Tax=Phytophthora fragariae TaxID=53985 RepID=A0A6A4EBR3_9STRA|nr:hypothetical protein PF003_g11831 [Phytophthora fragariae]KAE9126248.1 hypothetical protein PF010_g5332 [Phytophthora fragariae]KAE9132412.1 hypothetical protein PF007_g3730 [Phytophthora fragariae]KAE9146945.1 hypothetical protein PF006_g8333 [Phytophthora fragariae]KAE9224055.1 hypothetical protein PF005_g6060 [Phytophthora fragariae]